MRSLINILDFSTKELDELIKVASDILENPKKYSEICHGKQLGSLFFEPSTRTRLSFESAMLSLGGSVIGFADARSSSVSKGESVSDTVIMVSGYADIIAMRHPKEGAPIVASRRSRCPIINAGDGGHYHPTQTLADLYTIAHEKGGFENLTVGLCGDLKYGRTVHSLIGALSRYAGIKFVLISPNELKLPDYIRKEYIEKMGVEYEETTSLEGAISKLDVLYMTRIQKERFASQDEYDRLKDTYVLDVEKMALAKSDMIVLHPLPRVNEISVKVDDDKRACYFKQAYFGKYMRMALIIKLLGLDGKKEECESAYDMRMSEVELVDSKGHECKNPHCISVAEQELEKHFYVDDNGDTRCFYCDEKVSK